MQNKDQTPDFDSSSSGARVSYIPEKQDFEPELEKKLVEPSTKIRKLPQDYRAASYDIEKMLKSPGFELLVKSQEHKETSQFTKYLARNDQSGDDVPLQIRSQLNNFNHHLNSSRLAQAKEPNLFDIPNIAQYTRKEDSINNISKEFRTPNDHIANREIQKVSFSKDLSFKDGLKNDPGIPFPHHQTLNNFNFDNYEDKGLVEPRSSIEKSNYEFMGVPVYDTERRIREDIKSLEKSKSILNSKRYKNTPLSSQIDMTDLYDQDSYKNTVRQESNKFTNISDNQERQDISSGDFIQRSMHILEFMKNRTSDSASISKIKDDTVNSMDLASSPELGKTKDTSAFSGTKLLNNLANNKTQISMQNNSSISGNGSIFRKLINSSDFTHKKKAPKSKKINLDQKSGDFSKNSKYLSGTIDQNSYTSFAAR